MNNAPEFNTQFFAPAVAGVAMVAAGYRLYTWVAGGTTTPQATYTDKTGTTPNANPVVLDGEGRCNLWLDPALSYALELRQPVAMGGASVKVWDNVAGAAAANGTVSSVNGKTGAVSLDAGDVPYTTSSGATWHTGTNVEASLDQILNRLDAPPASSVQIADAGNFFTTDNVEAALQQLGAGSLMPARTGNDGKVLALAAGALAWERRETSYALAVNDGSAASRTVRLMPGTWQVFLDTRAGRETEGTNYDVTQSATVAATVGGSPTVTVTTTLHFNKASGFGNMWASTSDIAVGTLTVATEADFTMSIAAASLGGATGLGAVLRVEKIA